MDSFTCCQNKRCCSCQAFVVLGIGGCDGSQVIASYKSLSCGLAANHAVEASDFMQLIVGCANQKANRPGTSRQCCKATPMPSNHLCIFYMWCLFGILAARIGFRFGRMNSWLQQANALSVPSGCISAAVRTVWHSRSTCWAAPDVLVGLSSPSFPPPRRTPL